MAKELEPADTGQCQGMKRNGTGFGFGPPGPWVRCENQPSHIAYETEPGEDALMGSQSVCAECKPVMESYGLKVRFEAIKAKKARRSP